MIVKQGDSSIRVARKGIAEAARSVGVVEGDILMFHSSFKSIGTVEGGPDAIIDGLLDAVGAGGTLAVPTLCNWKPEQKHLVFEQWNPKTSPSYVGAITEIFRKRPEALRSDHATHSVAAIGARARELTENHGASGERLGPFGGKAFARESPWQKFYDWNAAYCFIGVNFRVNTMLHYVETMVVERALARCPADEQAIRREEVAGWMKQGIWPSFSPADRETIEALLTEKGIVRIGKLGAADFRCARTRPMIDEWLKIVEREPERWFPPVYCYMDWLGKIESTRLQTK